MSTAKPPAVEGIDVTALEKWMDDLSLGDTPISDVELLSGGTQNIMARFRKGAREFILRRPPLHLRAHSNNTMRREARLLAALHGSGVPHPRLIASCDDERVLGAAFYLMERVEGFNALLEMPPLHKGFPAIRRRMGLALAEGIATLAALDYKHIGLGDFGKVDNFLARQPPRWREHFAGYAAYSGWPGPSELPGVEDIAKWLEERTPLHWSPGLLHGDYHLANVMYRHDSGELAAIVDWELATVGDPLIDLGWLLATWPGPIGAPAAVSVTPWEGFPTSAELVEHYAARSSRDLSNINWYAVFAGYKLGILQEGTYARACAGQADREIGERQHVRACAAFERANAWISGSRP